MDYLIKKSDGSVIDKYGNATKVKLPGMTGSDAVHVKGDKRPMDLGDYLLITAVINETGSGVVITDDPPVVDVHAQTVTIARTLSALPPATVVSFNDFEDRFTAQEWDDATDYVYEVDTTTGKPKRKALVQGLARAQARNSIDLLDAKTDGFLSLLVAGNVLTAQRKTEILEP